jgi:putative transposase
MEEIPFLAEFTRGYFVRDRTDFAAFSVSSSKVELVKNYIINQKEHHKKLTFQEEVQQIMKEYEMLDYDERYFWK